MKRRSPEKEARAQALRRETAAYVNEIGRLLPEVLRRLREKSGLSIYELARCTGVKGQTISEVENGRRHANFLTVVCLAPAVAGSVTAFCEELEAARARQRGQNHQENGPS